MADKPIIFSTPMVRALLAGNKTQTRRVLKVDLREGIDSIFSEGRKMWEGCSWTGDRRETIPVRYFSGDRLWVREHWRAANAYDDLSPSAMGGEESIYYEADQVWQTWGWPLPVGPEDRFRQAMHMPRWASRLTLIVSDVRVQRLQDISEADAWAEGCKPGIVNDQGNPFPAEEPSADGKGMIGWDCARDWYADL